jgi:hypothetical protein
MDQLFLFHVYNINQMNTLFEANFTLPTNFDYNFYAISFTSIIPPSGGWTYNFFYSTNLYFDKTTNKIGRTETMRFFNLGLT